MFIQSELKPTSVESSILKQLGLTESQKRVVCCLAELEKHTTVADFLKSHLDHIIENRLDNERDLDGKSEYSKLYRLWTEKTDNNPSSSLLQSIGFSMNHERVIEMLAEMEGMELVKFCGNILRNELENLLDSNSHQQGHMYFNMLFEPLIK